MWPSERTRVSYSRARSYTIGTRGHKWPAMHAWSDGSGFLAGKAQKKFTAINDFVNLHTSAIGGNKWPEVALHGEQRLRARINNRVYRCRRWKKEWMFIYIASIWLHWEIDSGSFCVQKLYDVVMINKWWLTFPISNQGKNKHIDTSWFVFEVAIRFYDQQSCRRQFIYRMKFEYELSLSKKTFYGSWPPPSYGFIRPSTSASKNEIGNEKRIVYTNRRSTSMPPAKSKGPPCRRGWERDPRSYLTEWCTSTYLPRSSWLRK